MKRFVLRSLSCAAVLVLVAASTPHTAALAAQLEGATLADTLKAGDKTLKLNGLGLRKKALFKVYVGALYLESPSKDPAAILASDQAKAIRLHFLRDLSKGQLVEAFQEGFDANAKDKAAQKAAFDKMLALTFRGPEEGNAWLEVRRRGERRGEPWILGSMSPSKGG
jgi:hypothetical protein